MIWGAIKGMLSGLWGYIAAAGGALIALFVISASAKKAGKNEVIIETQEKEIKDVKTANEVERELAGTKPDARRERLYKRWSRD